MAVKAFAQIRDRFLKLKGDVQDWQGVLIAIATYIGGGWIGKILSAHGKLMGLPVPPWLKLWAAYASYITDDRKYIKAASEGSWSYTKSNIGDAMRWLGIDNDFGRKNTIMGTPDVAYEIPGNFPDQKAQSVKRPQASAQGKVLLDWMGPMFNKLESLYRLPEGLLKSVAITKSSGNQFAVGSETKYGSAKGLFQFVDGTAKGLGLRGNDVFDSAKPAQAAAKYLSQLLQHNGGDLNKHWPHTTGELVTCNAMAWI